MYATYSLVLLHLPAEFFQTWYIGNPFVKHENWHTFEKACTDGDKDKPYNYRDWVFKPHAWFKETIDIWIWIFYFCQTFEWYVMYNLIKEQQGKSTVTIHNERVTGIR